MAKLVIKSEANESDDKYESGETSSDKDEGVSELEMGIKHEAKEHSWLSKSQVERLTKDHLRENPSYYSDLHEFEEGEPKDHEDKEGE